MAIAGGILTVLGAWHALGDVVHHLNGWQVLLIIGIVVLALLGFDFCRQWVERRVAKLRRPLKNCRKSLVEQPAHSVRSATTALATLRRSLKPN